MKTKLIKSIVLLIVAFLLFIFPEFKVPVIDRNAEKYFNEAIQKAGLAYAAVQVINASVSVIKSSEIQLEPGGVGISVALGKAVDPVDDMTERLSDVLVTAIASLGVQRLLYEIGIAIAPSALAVLLILLSLLVWFEKWGIEQIHRHILGITAVIIGVRFFLPASSLVNDFLYQNFFLEDIMEARQVLTLASNELDQLKEINLPEIDGIAGTIKNSALLLEAKTIEFKDAIVIISKDMGAIVNNLLKLTWLYAGIFFIQVIALPMMMFWILLKFIKSLFSIKIPTASLSDKQA